MLNNYVLMIMYTTSPPGKVLLDGKRGSAGVLGVYFNVMWSSFYGMYNHIVVNVATYCFRNSKLSRVPHVRRIITQLSPKSKFLGGLLSIHESTTCPPPCIT